LQAALARHGYAVEPTGVLDRATGRVLMNFQMRYRPADYSGRPDAETAALLWVLTNPVAADAATPAPAAPLAPPDGPDAPPPPVPVMR
jgi:N-acetylmuramoyl-L-alanine amidase